MKVIIFFLNAAIQLVSAALAFFMLLIGLNGYHEQDATPSLIMYIVLALASAAGLGLASVYTTKRFSATRLGNYGAAALSVLGFAVVGWVILIIGWFAALLLAELVRKWI
jgi:uncharacterized protein YqgC (DUF456 family)